MELELSRSYTFMVQGQGSSRVERAWFKSPKRRPAGTDSFWTRPMSPEKLFERYHHPTPIRRSDHPLIEAKLEYIKANGGDPFTEYSLQKQF